MIVHYMMNIMCRLMCSALVIDRHGDRVLKVSGGKSLGFSLSVRSVMTARIQLVYHVSKEHTESLTDFMSQYLNDKFHSVTRLTFLYVSADFFCTNL